MKLKPVFQVVLGCCFIVLGCDREPAASSSSEPSSNSVQGQPIRSGLNTSVTVSNAPASFVPADFSRVDAIRDGVVQLGWDKLSGFKFDVYEVYSETNAGRPLIRSDDTIPRPLMAYNGKVVSITGFILPLRTKKGLVTEFLLLRDQGICCFGAQAQINHFIRVKYPAGFRFGEPIPVQVSGLLQVGEIYIQGYLTGIYQLDAQKVTLPPTQ